MSEAHEFVKIPMHKVSLNTGPDGTGVVKLDGHALTTTYINIEWEAGKIPMVTLRLPADLVDVSVDRREIAKV